MSDSSKAVFLSYASQDAEAARKICVALRASGVEVWFDADGGLEHGDEWDAKIRKQIRECVLFIPIISAHTQARHEGYFRLEWDLAAERARTIASGIAFILPVVIDDTREPEALVPDRFRMVQWTKLPGGVVTPEVKARYLKLWSHRIGVMGARASSPATLPEAGGTPAPPRKRRWLGPAMAALLVVAASAFWFLDRPSSALPPDSKLRTQNPKSAAPPATESEAARLITQARELIYDPDAARNEFALAESLLKRATDLAPDSAESWGASALLHHYFKSRGYDPNPQRLVRSQADAEKALRLQPRTSDALLAMALHRRLLGDETQARDFLQRAAEADPQNPRIYIALALQLPALADRAKFLQDAARKVTPTAELLYYAMLNLEWSHQVPAAVATYDQILATKPFWRVHSARATLEYKRTCNPGAVLQWLDRVPDSRRQEPRVVQRRFNTHLVARDASAAIRDLQAVAADYFDDNAFAGPKAFLLAQAHELDGRRDRAAEQWQIAERVLRDKIASNPADMNARTMLAVVMAALQRTAEARELADRCRVDERLEVREFDYIYLRPMENLAGAYARLGDAAHSVELLRRVLTTEGITEISAAVLKAEPRWDSLRAAPEFQALIREFDEAPVSLPTTRSTPTDAKSIAVLAFENLSGDKDNEYFSDGISEELLNVLAKVPGLRVAARTSAFYFKGKNATAQEIGQKLGVAHLVEGSVRREGASVRVMARLSRADTGEQLWSDKFEGELKNIFALQDEIAGRIAENLKLKLGAAPRVAKPVNPEAHRLYLEGRHFWSQRSEEGFSRAEVALQKAVEIDPQFARAHAGIADLWTIRGLFLLESGETGTADLVMRAQAAARRALELDPALVEVHATFGELHYIAGRAREAEEEIDRCLTLAPSYATARNWHGDAMMMQGRLDRGVDDYVAAARLDPLSPIMLYDCAKTLLFARRPAEALGYAERARALSGESVTANLLRARALLDLGRRDEAVAAVRLVEAKLETDYISRSRAWGAIHVLRQANEESAARVLMEKSLRLQRRDSFIRGFILASGGQMEEGLTLLAHTPPSMVAILFWDARFDSIRDDPAFQQLIAKLGRVADYKIARETLARMLPEQNTKR